ncbi:ABC transporter permease [Actinomadura sp. NPDC047616]|uniref:ABC transporter permease n=1 Tax=Actinomadura sp. NPDC047616 TaxID=3155914 RepID=UPI0034034B14
MTSETITAGRARPMAMAATLMPLSGLLLVLVAAAVATPGFYSEANLRLVLFQAGLIGVTAVGQTVVLLGRGIDLSVGAVMGLTTVIVALNADGDGGRLPGAIALAVVAGLVIGAVNAGLVVLRGVPPFVATFAVFVLVQGAITAWTRGAAAGDIPKALQPLGSGRWLGVPVPLWLFAAIAAVAAVVLARTSAGRRLYATGSNPRAARLSGIRTGRVLAAGYLVSALLAVLAGLISAGYAGHVDAQLSRSLDLNSLAASVIGGVALTGGRGHVGHTVVGVALLAVLTVWMIQLGAGTGGQLAVQGAAILLATWLRQRGPDN